MSKLESRIRQDLLQAVKNQDKDTIGILKLVVTDFRHYMLEKNKDKLSDEDVTQIVKKFRKRCQDSANEFKKAKRDDLYQIEIKQIEVLDKYLPTLMSEQEVQKVVEQLKEENNFTSQKDFGRLMGIAMVQLKDKADGQLVSKVVRSVLE